MTARLHHHVIVVGYGRVGRSVATALLRDGVPFIVVDRDPAVVERLRAGGHAALEGDGEQEDTLVAARIDSAAALVAAAPDDATNLVVVLSARALRPDLRVVARVDDPRWSNRLVKAGADVVRNPYEEFGANLAVSAVDTSVVGLHDLPGWGLRVEEIEVTAASSWAGRVAGELVAHLPGVLLMGLRSDRGVTRWHEVTGALSPGDVVVALGPPAAIERLRTTMAPAP